tara:strand:- start:268 stop:606 length:339 start_codon:yes stop_codon:yes gene_type:complete
MKKKRHLFRIDHIKIICDTKFNNDIGNIIFGYLDTVPKWSRYWKDNSMRKIENGLCYEKNHPFLLDIVGSELAYAQNRACLAQNSFKTTFSSGMLYIIMSRGYTWSLNYFNI